MSPKTHTMIAALGLCLGGFGVSAAAYAKPPKPPTPVAGGPTACGFHNLPLAAGNTWTYKNAAQEITIKIIDVAPGKDWAGKPATIVNAEESFAGRVVKAAYTCNAAGVTFPPESFFFSGEAGGAVGETYTVTARDTPSLESDSALGVADANWIQNVKADVARPDTAGAGAVNEPAKIEVELHVLVKPGGPIEVPLGSFPATTKVGFELRGRGIVDDQKIEIAIKRPGAFYISRGIGIVKVEDAFDKTWDLVDTNTAVKSVEKAP